jgi:phage replication initiation protein
MIDQGNHLVPPESNRGAQNTTEIRLRACVDWFQATLKSVQTISDVCDILGLPFSEFTRIEAGKYGYKSQYRYDHIAIYCDGHEDMGFHIEMSGQGCREFEQRSEKDWSLLCGQLMFFDANFTRIDLAIDDFYGYFNLSTILRKVRQKAVVSRFKNAINIETISLKDGKNAGHTIKFGSPRSRIQVTFYDKLAERKAAGKQIEDGITFWNRTEVRLRDERAAAAALLIAYQWHSIGQMVQGILKNYINFLIPNKNDRNKSRWKTAGFWEIFLNDVEPLQLTQVAPDRTIEKAIEWIDHQTSPSMAAIYFALEDISMIHDIIISNMDRLERKHLHMINKYRKEKGLSEYTWEQFKIEIRRVMEEQKLKAKKMNVHETNVHDSPEM